MAKLPIVLLGSTGSIGTQTLELLAGPGNAPGVEVEVLGLSAHGSAQALLAQAQTWKPPFVALADSQAADSIKDRLPSGTTLFTGPEANLELIAACDFEVAMHGIVGRRGPGPQRGRPGKGQAPSLGQQRIHGPGR